MYQTEALPTTQEIMRLRDLLPASLRAFVTIVPGQGSLIQRRPQAPWQPRIQIQLDLGRWLALPQGQRDLLFLREVGWAQSRSFLQPGLYQFVTLAAGVGTLVEAVLGDPVGVVMAGGLAAVAARQIWLEKTGEAAHFAADDFALARAEFRGYSRAQAAAHLWQALERLPDLDRTDVTTLVRLQRLQALARGVNSPAHSGGNS
ncbi:MAG: DUF3318 domain-containing protein [Thermostichales cyanobacterium SZTDM-1c_bins_54]